MDYLKKLFLKFLIFCLYIISETKNRANESKKKKKKKKKKIQQEEDEEEI